MGTALTIHNGEPASVSKPTDDVSAFRDRVTGAVRNGGRICALLGMPSKKDDVEIMAVVGDDAAGLLSVFSTAVSKEYPSLTVECLQAHLFERIIAEDFSVVPVGHPWLKPVRSPREGLSAVTDFFRVEGDEVHEVAVGPVHAGVIEPGHFRFQCHGEDVMHLEIALGYQHRGVERAVEGGPDVRTMHYMETLAGDTTVGHALAHCEAVEALSGTEVPLRAQGIRGIALELERMANHAGDLGALAGDVGFLPTAAYCGRIRGDVLNLTALISGSRFGRGLVQPGGVAFDLEPERGKKLASWLGRIMSDLESAVNLMWGSPSVLARFEEIGIVTHERCEHLGLVGPAARACGVERDVRNDYPSGIYRFHNVPTSTWHSGDVYARAFVRWLELTRSHAFIQEQMETLAGGPISVTMKPLASNALVVTLVEGWRGEICHVLATDKNARFRLCRVYDPSIHNWSGLAMAMRGGQISDFPLCNKSFNLSYCGHDL
jgi:Ni,Fe-hydrogenase III large subunit